MDSHFEMVQRERAAAGDTPVKYFAYSTILDREALVEWRDNHGYQGFELPAGQLGEALDVALVYDFPSRWWGGRAAGLVDQKGAHVFGRVFEIPGKEWAIVRHKEGAITKMAVERPLKVKVDGQVVDCVAFATAPARASQDGAISDRFVEALLRGARSAQLPEAWIDELRRTAK